MDLERPYQDRLDAAAEIEKIAESKLYNMWLALAGEATIDDIAPRVDGIVLLDSLVAIIAGNRNAENATLVLQNLIEEINKRLWPVAEAKASAEFHSMQ